MVNVVKGEIAQAIDAHTASIDKLHETLAAAPGVDRDRLQKAVEKYKIATQTFHDDALGCMN